MTAIEYREYGLRCNHTSSAGRCRTIFRGRPLEPRARVRKRAEREGWITVRSPSGRRCDEDYCPEHAAHAAYQDIQKNAGLAVQLKDTLVATTSSRQSRLPKVCEISTCGCTGYEHP